MSCSFSALPLFYFSIKSSGSKQCGAVSWQLLSAGMDPRMTAHRNDTHAKQVDAWARRNPNNLPAKERPQLYAKAIQAIERRSLNTLSRVTVMVIVDRAIHETKEKFPILTNIKIEDDGIDFSALFETSDVNCEELENALRELLIELLNVFGSITADILTIPLHKELMSVTPMCPHSMNLAKKNREQK